MSNSRKYVLKPEPVDKIILEINADNKKRPNETYKQCRARLNENDEKIILLNNILSKNESDNVEIRKKSVKDLRKFLKENGYIKNDESVSENKSEVSDSRKKLLLKLQNDTLFSKSPEPTTSAYNSETNNPLDF